MISGIFKIKANDKRKRFEFTPRVKGFTSYTVSFSECETIEDAMIAVWKSIQAESKRNTRLK